MRSSTVFTIITGVAAVSAADCAAAGNYDGQGRYSCNPATQYPNGQTCKTIDGCPLLCDANGAPILKGSGTTTGSTAQPTSTCVAGGGYDSKGRYSCNPAHQYPNGQTCNIIDGCHVLCDSNGTPIVSSTTSSAQPTTTNPANKCAGAGDYDSLGRYSCNPAHQYPNGQTCKTIDGCPLLCDANGKPITKIDNNGNNGNNGDNGNNGNNGNNGQTTGMPIVTGGGSVLKGGMSLIAAALAALF